MNGISQQSYENDALDAVLSFLAASDMAGRLLAKDEEMLASGALDSLKILNLVAFVEQQLGCKINAEEVLPRTLDRLWKWRPSWRPSQKTKLP